jgi:hypothetical protein
VSGIAPPSGRGALSDVLLAPNPLELCSVNSPVSIKSPVSPWSGTDGTTYGKSVDSGARTRFYEAFRKEFVDFDKQRKSHDTEYNLALAYPVPAWLTILLTGTLIPVTRSLVKDIVDTRTGRKPPVRRRSTMPPKKSTDPPLIPADDEAPTRRFLLRGTELEGYETDSQCVSWMFARNIDSDVSNAVLGFIPEIVWHSGIQGTPLIQVYDALLQCFSPSTPESKPALIPHMRDKASDAANAFVHLFIQRQCIGDEDQELIEQLTKKSKTPLSLRRYESDPDLESTLGLANKLLGHDVTIPWPKFVLSFNHHSWLSHILLYRAWDTTRDTRKLTSDVTGFIEHTMALDPPAASSIKTDCLLMVGLLVGMPIHTDDLLIGDKRYVPMNDSGVVC